MKLLTRIITCITVGVIAIQPAGRLTPPAEAQSSLRIEISAVGSVDESTRAAFMRAFETILKYYQQEFGAIPVPFVHLYLFGDRSLYERGLVEVARVAPDLASIYARTGAALASGGNWSILVNTSARTRLEFLVAHEFMHLMQAGWGGRRSETRGPQWLREGMADFYAARADEALGLGSFDRRRQLATDAVKQRIGALLALPLTMDQSLFARLNDSLGRASNGLSILYAWSFLAYERLESMTPRSRILAFYGVSNTGANLAGAFEQALQIRLADFEADLKDFLQSLP